MKVGDLVIRKKGKDLSSRIAREYLGYGIILSKQMDYACITVIYPSVGKTFDIAESLVEVISESR